MKSESIHICGSSEICLHNSTVTKILGLGCASARSNYLPRENKTVDAMNH
uniref:Uncharacterized protein n=1 Tax=Anguilla anguilla TaxID=7936 RepID=A0A0E9RZM6_ANGAN